MEGFGAAVAFDYAEFNLLDGLVRCVTGSARDTLAAPANSLAFLNGARVDHTVAHVSATGATHSVLA